MIPNYSGMSPNERAAGHRRANNGGPASVANLRRHYATAGKLSPVRKAKGDPMMAVYDKAGNPIGVAAHSALVTVDKASWLLNTKGEVVGVTTTAGDAVTIAPPPVEDAAVVTSPPGSPAAAASPPPVLSGDVAPVAKAQRLVELARRRGVCR